MSISGGKNFWCEITPIFPYNNKTFCNFWRRITEGQSLHSKWTQEALPLCLKCTLEGLSLCLKCNPDGLSLLIKCTTMNPKFLWYFFSFILDCIAKMNDSSLSPFFNFSPLTCTSWPPSSLGFQEGWTLLLKCPCQLGPFCILLQGET